MGLGTDTDTGIEGVIDGPIMNGLWFTYNNVTNTTTLAGDTNGDLTADFTLTLLNFNGFGPYSDPLSPPPDQMVAGVI